MEDFDLPILDDRFTFSGSNGSNSHDDEEESSESSIRIHDSLDGTNDGQNHLVTTRHVVNIEGDGEDGSGEQPLMRRKRNRDFAASVALAAILLGGGVAAVGLSRGLVH